MKLYWKQSFPQKHKYLLVKLGVSFLFLGLAFRLLFVRSTEISPKIESPFPQNTLASRSSVPPQLKIEVDPPPFSVQAPSKGDQISGTGNSISTNAPI